jgi:hypothetical protein
VLCLAPWVLLRKLKKLEVQKNKFNRLDRLFNQCPIR